MSNKTVVALVVDDEETDSALVRNSLEHTGGFQVLEAKTYDAAVRAFAERRDEIDVLIVDVALPGRDGIELARTCLRQRPELRVLFMSGKAGAELLRAYRTAEADRHYLPKPLDPAEVIVRVQSIIGEAEGVDWLAGPSEALA
jgi:DNA-binding response OmpR family regulator